ncbi:Toxin To12, partial [Frankliniella fusca]
ELDVSHTLDQSLDQERGQEDAGDSDNENLLHHLLPENDMIVQDMIPADQAIVHEVRGEHLSDVDSSSDSQWSDDLDQHQESDHEDEALNATLGDDDEDFVPAQSDSDAEEESEEESAGTNFNLDSNLLGKPLQFNRERTLRESLIIDLALMTRHKWTYESLMDIFKSKNVLFGGKFFPTSKSALWKIVGKKNSGIVSHVYCECGFYLGRRKSLPAFKKCVCNANVEISKAKTFITLNLKKQLIAFLSNPEVQDHLKYKQNRERVDSLIQDVFDGKQYQKLEEDMTPDDLTYTMNVDGCKTGKSAKISIYPFFLRINEFPPNLRQKFILLAGIYCDKGEPHMSTFLLPIVMQLNALAKKGVEWEDTEKCKRCTKLRPFCFCVDGKARWQILNMSPHTSYYGCTSCLIKGVPINKTMRYPNGPHEDIPPYGERTHGQMLKDMKLAAETKQVVNGHRGFTPLVLLENFDLVKQGAFDDLHYLYECCAALNLDLLMEVALRKKDVNDKKISKAHIERTIDSRLQLIKTPINISRKPSAMKITNRKQFTATEFRNMLIYYGVVIFQGLVEDDYIEHFGMLSHVAFLLSQESISLEDIEKADALIERYLDVFDKFYGLENTRLNLHSLRHATQSVVNLGPLHLYSTFNFESWNHELLQCISSPKTPVLQIITRHLLHTQLDLLMTDGESLPEDICNLISGILKKKRRAYASPAGCGVYVVGAKITRPPTAKEQELLQKENLQTNKFDEYKRVIIKSTEYHSYEVLRENSLSDNSIVFTKDGKVCLIKSVVTLTNQEHTQECGMFVFQKEALQTPFQVAPHIYELSGKNESEQFLPVSKVKSPMVQIPLNNRKFVAPLPNLHEID